MRVLIISGEDLAGGGHRAAFRLHQALRGIGVESFMAVRRKHSSDPYVHQMSPAELGWPPIGRGYLDLLPSVLCHRKDEPISLGLQSANLGKLVKRFNPDVINLHWINAGIASICSVGKLDVPVVWTLHDMWPFTGGCHYSGECAQYHSNCAECPKIKPIWGAPLITRWIYNRKRHHWYGKPLHAITPSAWMRDLALSSSLFGNAEVTHIRNCVNPTVFNGHAREITRDKLGLSANSKAILFSSANQPRKGALIIPEVIRLLRTTHLNNEWRFLFMGGLPPALERRQDVVVLPHTTDETRVASYYAASDIYALPSFEDNLPNTVSESLNCGTPVAAFPVGGIVEMIDSGRNGVLSSSCTHQSLSEAILKYPLPTAEERTIIAGEANKVYQPSYIAHQHERFYREVLSAAPV
jgi:glycosyltransferase involved in cell wall biosynthesis